MGIARFPPLSSVRPDLTSSLPLGLLPWIAALQHRFLLDCSQDLVNVSQCEQLDPPSRSLIDRSSKR